MVKLSFQEKDTDQKILLLVKFLAFGLGLMGLLIFLVLEKNNYEQEKTNQHLTNYHERINSILLEMSQELSEFRIDMYQQKLTGLKILKKEPSHNAYFSVEEKFQAVGYAVRGHIDTIITIQKNDGDIRNEQAIRRLENSVNSFMVYTKTATQQKNYQVNLAEADSALYPLLATINQLRKLENYHAESSAHVLKKNAKTQRVYIGFILLLFGFGAVLLTWRIICKIRESLNERKKILDVLEEGESLLSQAQQISHIGHWDWNIASGNIEWSPEIYRIFGHEPDSITPTYDAFLAAIHQDDRELVKERLNEALEEFNVHYQVEHRIIRPDGELRFAREEGRVYREQDGKPIRMIGTVQDITEQKLASAELEYSQARFKAMFASLSDAVVVANTEREMIIVNQATQNYFGYTEEELLGNPTSMLYAHPQDFKQTGKQHFNVDAKDSPLAYEIEYRRKDGSVFWGETLGTKIESDDNKVFGFVGIIRDVTDRKKTAMELEKHRENLEGLVAERTQELMDTQTELVRKERLATLGQLTATVSHELRNPLGAMRPSLYIVQKTTDPKNEKLQQAVERLDRNISRCDHIIDELLDFTRITSLEMSDVVIDEWMQRLIDEQVVPEGIKLIRDLNLDGFKSSIDTHRLRRAIINVIDNGCQAMQDESSHCINVKNPELTITTRDQGSQIEIAIRDTGSGIPDDVFPHIFEPLFSTKGFGVGLGMPTVKQIVEQHGGNVDIESKVGEGTTVRLLIPKNGQEIAKGARQ